MGIKIGNWGGPWRNAPLRDRVLMLGALHPNGIRRERLGERLRVLGALLNTTLARLVDEDWMTAEHPDDRPSSSSVYTLNQDREGLEHLLQFWHIEYGFSPRDEPHARIERERAQPGKHSQFLAAATHAPADAPVIPARTYRSLRNEALDQFGRTDEIQSRMGDIYAAGKDGSERARDIIHLPPEHGVSLPSAHTDDEHRVADLLRLAATCREASRKDAWKFRYLATSSDAALHRLRAMSEVLGHGSHALAPLLVPHEIRLEEALRSGATIAATSAFLEGRHQYARIDDFLYAGDVLIAYLYRDMARKLEDIATRIIALPSVAPAADSSIGKMLLGEPADLELPASAWPNNHARVLERTERTPAGIELGEEIHLAASKDLRPGDVIIGVGDTDLTAVVPVHASPKAGYVELTIDDGYVAYTVPLSVLDDHQGLRIRRPQESTVA